MDLLKKYWPMIVTVVTAASTFLSPTVAGFWSNHPTVVSVVTMIWATFKWLAPSPMQPK